ncbi:UNVERIFIED_CONTAM: hypothetical protein HDU68_007907, partial [Siphonaria sp. JEL0065]
VHVSKARLNEVLLWKKKYKDLESEKHKLEENFAVFIKKLEKAEAERDKVQQDFNEAQIQFAQRLSYDTYSLESLTDVSGSRRSLTKRQTSIRNPKPRKSRTDENYEYDDVVRYFFFVEKCCSNDENRLQSPSAFTPKLQKNIKSLDEEFEATGSPAHASKSPTTAPPAGIPAEADDKVRKAKTQLEYNAYVKTKTK